MATASIIIDPRVVGRGRDLLERAQLLFENADGVTDDAERFRQYYLTALRAAGAALAVYESTARPTRRRSSRSAWARMAAIVPELRYRADEFAGLSDVRMDIEAGIRRAIAPERVDVMRHSVVGFLDEVERIVIAYEQGKLSHQAVQTDQTA